MQDWEALLIAWSRRLRAHPDAPRLGVDTGGTFTDFVQWEGRGRPRAWKAPSQPADPGAPIRAALSAGRLDATGARFLGIDRADVTAAIAAAAEAALQAEP